MSNYPKNIFVVSPNMARFVALELPLQSLTKKDIVMCLKASGAKKS